MISRASFVIVIVTVIESDVRLGCGCGGCIDFVFIQVIVPPIILNLVDGGR